MQFALLILIIVKSRINNHKMLIYNDIDYLLHKNLALDIAQIAF
jgi:hypothetical protein